MTTIKMRKVGAGLIGLLTTLAVVGGSAPSAMADETDAPAPPPKVEVVLDVSGSMKANDAGGMTRIDAAKKAFNEIVDSVPETAEFGVRVLGATYPGTDKKLGCVDTQQLTPVGNPNKVVIKNAIAKLAPTGFTPIALSLREAAKDLGTGAGTRRIVLITDGEETCAPPDPCDVARELAASGLNLVVDTLGLVPDENTRRQLSCIADATGGTYTSVQNSEELSQRVQQIVKRAVREADETPRPSRAARTAARTRRCSRPACTATARNSANTSGTRSRSSRTRSCGRPRRSARTARWRATTT